MQILTTGLFWMLRARFAYFKVFRVSSALISAGLIQAATKIFFYVRRKVMNLTTGYLSKVQPDMDGGGNKNILILVVNHLG